MLALAESEDELFLGEKDLGRLSLLAHRAHAGSVNASIIPAGGGLRTTKSPRAKPVMITF
jgi:hypothetical protein